MAHAGELHPRVIAMLGLPERSCAFTVVVSALPISGAFRAKSLLTMPPAIQDIALVVDDNIPAAQVEAALRKGAGELLESIDLFDRYDKLGDGKVSLAYSMLFRAPDRTLTADEVSAFRAAAAESALKECGATVRS